MSESTDLYIGLMSGTSVDGIDAALLQFQDHRCQLLAHHFHTYEADLRARLQKAAQSPRLTHLEELGGLHAATGAAFADAALALLDKSGVAKHRIRAIGSHGQTLLHAPNSANAFSLQIGEPATIASRSGLLTVADFRAGDLAVGGQGAPLAPAFHAWAFAAETERAVVNLGGIANITRLRPDSAVIGFDTGPASTLLDYWCQVTLGQAYDDRGSWAASGQVHQGLLQAFMADPYLSRLPPKSTGVDYFCPAWLTGTLDKFQHVAAVDVQASLAEFTAATVSDAILAHTQAQEIGVCGGGSHNDDLMRRIASRLPGREILTTEDWGVSPDWVEAAAFAWLAQRRLAGLPSNEPAVTGARARVSLGAIYQPPTEL